MQVEGFEFPDELYYYPEEHVWVKIEGDMVTVGITSLGQYMAGKIFQVTTKNKGEKVTPKSVIFTLESAKWIGKFRLPVEGEIVDINDEVVKNPTLINEKPYDAWIVKIKGDIKKEKLLPVSEAVKIFENDAKRVIR
ncbi:MULTISPECIES: glycine cleavage system protein H [Sulfurisphaera]|uniref:Probable glycine cleavage system H protein 3 n=3 Tax=Sulfurisphaera TaxID=69655 RepID=GCSH3_SULTO|nr:MULTISPECIES: glycine cleavage system protein H [Sulfurisphaera]Q96ZD7.1 RecName: Full=Probable glycine cleavage system H protein 3 [Sulfurisphaera tokodaii str. 7]MBB5254567.1 glycine cleavage system H lipoate-binding protein [Sulfurisphaera ohwakuensis]QGR17598.1 glycine cleavage system protein H [Sulfurisphaera ohwakuensis]BAB66988.1 putative glycine cleavage system H-protein [Sulfurisphaera tokodaii str. 7]HII75358.1 glycine cleavage system protein H [Sulfurisphaera tokodaii]